MVGQEVTRKHIRGIGHFIWFCYVKWEASTKQKCYDRQGKPNYDPLRLHVDCKWAEQDALGRIHKLNFPREMYLPYANRELEFLARKD